MDPGNYRGITLLSVEENIKDYDTVWHDGLWV